nr:hypothetical protein [Sphingomonas sp. Leaf242]
MTLSHQTRSSIPAEHDLDPSATVQQNFAATDQGKTSCLLGKIIGLSIDKGFQRSPFREAVVGR